MSTIALERHLKPLMPFLNKSGVTEICINEPQVLFVEKNKTFTKHIVKELEFGFLESLAALIAEFNHKIFPTPLLSGVLPSGERIQFVMNPGCESDKIICSIRRHQMKDLSLNHYEESGSFESIKSEGHSSHIKENQELLHLYNNKDILGFLRQAILARKNIIISGGTGTGKTTFLNACLKLIPDNERLITVEDTREVSIKQPNKVHLLFNEDDIDITALKIFKTCLRLRPDRIFLSELRGQEAWPFLRAANSGHPGSLSTVHADTPQACIDQLVFMMQQAGSTSSEERIRLYIQSIVHVIVQLKRSVEPDKFVTVSDIYFDAAIKAELSS